MDNEHNWLPELLLLEDFAGDPKRYLEAAYQIFQRDFEHSKPKFGTYKVNLKWMPIFQGKSATFWHMISEGKEEADRTPDFRRLERIGWVKPILEAFQETKPTEQAKLYWWIELRGNEQRYHITLTDFSYLVVVVKRKNFVLPWTAFYVEYGHQRRKYKKRYEEFWRQEDAKKAETASEDGFVTPSTIGR